MNRTRRIVGVICAALMCSAATEAQSPQADGFVMVPASLIERVTEIMVEARKENELLRKRIENAEGCI